MDQLELQQKILGEVPDSSFGRQCGEPFPPGMVLTVLARNPIQLESATSDTILSRPIPSCRPTNETLPASVSIVVVTFNNLQFTRLCLESLLATIEFGNCEVLVVDNASTDGTSQYLRSLAFQHPKLRLILNDSNRGFAAANNQALALASGEILILLNNDTILGRGWVTALTNHLKDPSIALVGPITNRLGNEAEIKTSYRTYGELQEFIASIAQRTVEPFDIRIGSMFCLAMRRSTFEQLGPLDEQFGVGMFEDDDYSMRARAAGLRVVCAENVFVHHFGGASFGNLAATGEFGPIFHANRQRWEEKWLQCWTPPCRRRDEEYDELAKLVNRAVCELTPSGAHLLVVSKGDEYLLDLLRNDGRIAAHFPQLPDGSYSGYYPVDSSAAVEELERLRNSGFHFLIIPKPAYWWLDHYHEFALHRPNCNKVGSPLLTTRVFAPAGRILSTTLRN